MLDIIRSLDLPNNPLDDIIDQVVLFIPVNKAEHYVHVVSRFSVILWAFCSHIA